MEDVRGRSQLFLRSNEAHKEIASTASDVGYFGESMIYLTPQKEWPTDEEIKNMDNEERQRFIFDYYNGAYAKAGYKPKFIAKMKYRFKSLFYALIGLLLIGILYGLFNLIFIGGQSLWHMGDKHKLEALKQKMDNELVTIHSYESSNSKGTLTQSQYKEYTAAVDLYNSQVTEYNDLAKKVGTTYYVVPVPRIR